MLCSCCSRHGTKTKGRATAKPGVSFSASSAAPSSTCPHAAACCDGALPHQVLLTHGRGIDAGRSMAASAAVNGGGSLESPDNGEQQGVQQCPVHKWTGCGCRQLCQCRSDGLGQRGKLLDVCWLRPNVAHVSARWQQGTLQKWLASCVPLARLSSRVHAANCFAAVCSSSSA